MKTYKVTWYNKGEILNQWTTEVKAENREEVFKKVVKFQEENGDYELESKQDDDFYTYFDGEVDSYYERMENSFYIDKEQTDENNV